MLSVNSTYNVLDKDQLEALRSSDPGRFKYSAEAASYINLKGVELPPMPGVDEEKIMKLSRVIRAFCYAAIEGGKSGHPGGSSAKTEQLLTLLLGGVLGFDPLSPKNNGRDRLIWSAGHCSPLLHSLGALVYEALRRKGIQLTPEAEAVATHPEDLPKFRTLGGPSGHIESIYALADSSTGASGHGLSAGLGMAVLHRSCGLPTKTFVIAGDAETEEGMTYEARNIASAIGAGNLIVSLDFNDFGIDGHISEAIPYPYQHHWVGQGWNIIEADGHNVRELAYAYRLAAQAAEDDKPTVIIARCVKGKAYGKLENTATSHGAPLSHDEYVEAVKLLGFDIPGKAGEAVADVAVVADALDAEDVDYIVERLNAAAGNIAPEEELQKTMTAALGDRPMADYTTVRRPDTLPAELVFPEGGSVATRKASEAWFDWTMKNNSFFYIGSGDLMKSILTGKAEDVYGVISRKNKLGRGIRFGIAEQNMAMMSTAMAQDTLPGGFRPMSAFATYGVFVPMMANSVRMSLINSDVNPKSNAFFIVLAAHDGPETGEDGQTHHGLFWMSLFTAYPGIKVYKPLDANETVEMLFHAAQVGEPVAFSVARPGTPVLKRGDGIPPAIEATKGAYVFKQYTGNQKRKLVLAVSGGQTMVNTLEVLPEIEREADVKIVAVTSPQLFEQLRKEDPKTANEIFSDEERQHVVTIHNGWPGFMYPFMLPADYTNRAYGMDRFLRSGSPPDVYKYAGFDPQALKEKILKSLK